MNRKCWMLVISMAMSIPSIIGLACESKEHKASEKAALHAIGRMRGGDATDASLDGMIDASDSPGLRRFAEEAKARAAQDDDINAIAAEAR